MTTEDPAAGLGPPDGGSPTYAESGVNLAEGERAVELIRSKVARTSRPEVVSDLGGFAGLFAVDFGRYRRPVLATSTDGVGTKLVIARDLDRHRTVGIDLVGMVVDDLVVCGAEPLFMTDYIACGRVVPERIAEIVDGIAEGCRMAGCALIGGEIAEHPATMGDDDFDLAGAGVGIVDADRLLSPQRVRLGDAVIAMASSGLHSNGYSLVRHALLHGGRKLRLDAAIDELGGESLGEALLTPTRIYARDCLALLDEVDVHGFAHVTGGGLAANLSRVLPEHLGAVVDRATWSLPPIFGVVSGRGRVEQAEMERTFNQGVGMVAVVSADEADRALAILTGRRVPAWQAGEVVTGRDGTVRLVGEHAN